MRLRLRQLFDQSLAELHWISTLGTRLCFYCLDKNPESLTPLAPNAAYVEYVAMSEVIYMPERHLYESHFTNLCVSHLCPTIQNLIDIR